MPVGELWQLRDYAAAKGRPGQQQFPEVSGEARWSGLDGPSWTWSPAWALTVLAPWPAARWLAPSGVAAGPGGPPAGGNPS